MSAPAVLMDRLSTLQRSATRLGLGQAIIAGAGSGKSTTLVVRYLLAIRAANFDVHRVLAVTFTNKAAAELKRRIRHSVLALGRGDVRLESTSDLIASAEQVSWLRVADALPEAWITTLHGFCQRSLRAGSPDGSLGAQFQVIGEDGTGHPAAEIVESFLDSAVTNPDGGVLSADVLSWLKVESLTQLTERLTSLLRWRHRADPWAKSLETRGESDVEHLAKSLFQSSMNQLMREIERSDARWIARLSDDPAWRIDAANRLEGVVAFHGFPFGRAAKVQAFVEGLSQLRSILLRVAVSPEEARLALEIRQSIRQSSAPSAPKAMEEGSWKAQFKALEAAAIHVVGPRVKIPDGSKLCVHHDLNLEKALARLYSACLPRLHDRFRASNQVDFDGLIDHALAKLESGSEVALEFDHVLVDEFQDTDPRQWRLVKALKPDLMGVCIVGDEKQSIYRFREGDVETFRRASSILQHQAGAQAEGLIQLNENFRSSSALVGFANMLSREIFVDPSRGERPEPYECIASPMTARRIGCRDSASHIQIRVLRGDGRNDARRQESAHIASLIHDEILGKWQVRRGGELRPATASDIAVLMEKRTGLPALETALAHRGVKFRTVAGRGFYERPEVKECCALLAWLADPDDSMATLGLVRSMMVALPDTILARVCADRPRHGLWKTLKRAATEPPASLSPSEREVLVHAIRSLERWKILSGVFPASSLLDVVIRETTLRLSLGQFDPSGRAEANLDQFVAQVRERESYGDASFATLAREFSTLMDADSNASQADPPVGEHAVTLMTTHGSKGLEFPIVLVVGLGDARTNRGLGSKPIQWTVAEDQEAFIVDVPRDTSVKQGLRESLSAIEKSKAKAEAARLLYVAVTRAEDHLVLIGSDVIDQKRSDNALTSLLAAAHDRGVRVDREHPIEGVSGATVHIRFIETQDVPSRPEPSTIDVFPTEYMTERESIGTPSEVIYRVPLRPTSFATAMSCSRKFFLEQGLGAPQSRSAHFPTQTPTASKSRTLAPTSRGNAIHAAFEALSSGGAPSDHVEWACASAGISERTHVDEVRSIVVSAERGFFAWSLGARIKAAQPGEVRSELPITLDINGLPVIGTMDLLYAPRDGGTAYVIDFKSDAVRDLADAKASIERKGYRAQLALYCVAVQRILRRPVEGYLFLTALGCELRVVGSAEIAEAEASLSALALAAKSGYPKTHDPTVCESCDHLVSGRCGGVRREERESVS